MIDDEFDEGEDDEDEVELELTEDELLALAQEAFAEWLRVVDDILHDAELSFEEFNGHGLRGEMPEAGAALARAECSVNIARAVLARVVGEGEDDGAHGG